ncbi:hypothetical protein Ancab_037411 [Ancistrocladus abbreviatus]
MDCFDSDVQSLWSHMKYLEAELEQKRRLLIGVCGSTSEQKQVQSDDTRNLSALPESVLRDDDVCYDNVKQHVERGFRTYNNEDGLPVTHSDMEISVQCINSRTVLSMLDNLTNSGLYLLATIITEGSVVLETTRWKMKKAIKEHLSEIQRNRSPSINAVKIYHQLSQLLKDPRNFNQNNMALSNPTVQSHYSAVIKVLDELENMPFQTINKMYQKLRGVKVDVPQLKPPRYGWKRDKLIKRVKMATLSMLSNLGKWDDELPEPLANAMAIASLSLKLRPDYQSISDADFCRFNPDIEVLHNDIIKAVWSVEMLGTSELKNVKLLLDPEARVPDRGLKEAIKKMLTEFLFECGDMGAIPDSLLDAVAVINRSSGGTPSAFFCKEVIGEEVECILSTSAQMKQILWDCLLDYEFDQDFADAYVEELEDDADLFDAEDVELLGAKNMHTVQINLTNFTEEVESTGDFEAHFNSPVSMNSENDSSLLPIPTMNLKNELIQKLNPESQTNMNLMDPGAVVTASSFGVSRCVNDTEHTGNKLFQVDTHSSRSNENAYSPLVSLASRPNSCIPQGHHPTSNTIFDSVSGPLHCDIDFACTKPEFVSVNQKASRNKYLLLQEVCDETSLVAYQLIGCVLEGFARMKELAVDPCGELYLGGTRIKKNSMLSKQGVGASFIARAVQEVLPSFSNSELEKVKKLTGLR